MKKICRVCELEKDINDFGNRKGSSDGHRNDCKNCRSEYLKTYKERNKEVLSNKKKIYNKKNKVEIAIKNKIYREQNKEALKIKSKEYRAKNKDKISAAKRKFNTENKEKVALRKKTYYENNREKENKRKNKWTKNKLKNDPLFKLKCNVRVLIKNTVKNAGYIKTSKSEQILGCSIEEFKIYLESLFLNGMNWENHGDWHLDHIIPVSYAKNEEELIKLNHYTNYQPLWAVDNLKKGNRWKG